MIANGYQVIDLKNKPLTTGATVKGLYAQLEGLEKMPLFINAQFTTDDGTVEVTPFTSPIGTFGDIKTFIIHNTFDSGSDTIYVTYVSVTSADEVTISTKTIA